jgi:hypothetical protein
MGQPDWPALRLGPGGSAGLGPTAAPIVPGGTFPADYPACCALTVPEAKINRAISYSQRLDTRAERRFLAPYLPTD